MFIVKAIYYEMDMDADIAIKYGSMLRENGFEVLERQIKKVHYGNQHCKHAFFFFSTSYI